ncbi:siderophore ABC transporter substrate-binding protein [Wansuia hejianensis]|uniref:Siderophore ABC transporter substrate-binding protein n=1 Tax=Wansuia hejianensis TaxID=2763667 RepID=A0A926EY00_9FIRM|nr:siderophore ABC transporter substrate-binding protein [Wansuia hejianensis]MBC8591041.1 siderophore ABC transporter substrate-binding protein [Wansuia hejianensis]
MKNIKRLGLLVLVIMGAFAMVACNSQPKTVDKEQVENQTINIKHQLGEVSLDKTPNKVVVFDYGVLDALDKIGQDIVGLPKKTVPQYLDKYKGDDYVDVGTLKEPNFEKIYELNPDLIIISGRQAELYDEFKKIAPTVYLTIEQEDYIGSLKNNMEVLGEIFDKKEELEKEVENIEDAIESLNEKAKSMDKNALFIMANDGNISAFGSGSRFGMLHKEFGVKAVDENIDSSQHGQKISFEYIVEKDPDYIYVMDRVAVTGGDISAKQVMDNDLIKSTKAYKNNNIIYLDAHVWYVSSGGITSTMKMIEEIQSSLDN